MTDDTAEEDAMSETVPYDSPARHVNPLTPDQAGHLARTIERQSTLTRRKYIRGQVVHGDNCWEKPGLLPHALDEVTDLSVYLWSLREQLVRIATGLREEGMTPEQAAEALERIVS